MASACAAGSRGAGKDVMFRIQQYQKNKMGENYDFSNVVMGGNSNFVVKRLFNAERPQSTAAATSSGQHKSGITRHGR